MTLIDQKSRPNSFCSVCDAATENSASSGCARMLFLCGLLVHLLCWDPLGQGCTQCSPYHVLQGYSFSGPSNLAAWSVFGILCVFCFQVAAVVSEPACRDCAPSWVNKDMICVLPMMYCRCSASLAAQISRPGQSVRLLRTGGASVARELTCRVSRPFRYVMTMTCALNSGCCPVSDAQQSNDSFAVLCAGFHGI